MVLVYGREPGSLLHEFGTLGPLPAFDTFVVIWSTFGTFFHFD